MGRGGVYLLPPDILEPQKRYSIQIVCDFAASDPVYFDTVSGGEEVIEEILKKHEAKKSLFSQSTEELFNETVLSPFLQEDIYKANLETIAPKEFFSSASLSKQMMENINIDVWKLDDYGKRYASTMTLTVNKNLKDNYTNAFRELFALAFPIKSVGCYNYRNTYFCFYSYF